MTHCQIFYPFDNEDGFISVVCHRERFLEDLLSIGWQKTADEAIAYGAGKKGPDPETVMEVPEMIAGNPEEPKRKKLSLKK